MATELIDISKSQSARRKHGESGGSANEIPRFAGRGGTCGCLYGNKRKRRRATRTGSRSLGSEFSGLSELSGSRRGPRALQAPPGMFHGIAGPAGMGGENCRDGIAGIMPEFPGWDSRCFPSVFNPSLPPTAAPGNKPELYEVSASRECSEMVGNGRKCPGITGKVRKCPKSSGNSRGYTEMAEDVREWPGILGILGNLGNFVNFENLGNF